MNLSFTSASGYRFLNPESASAGLSLSEILRSDEPLVSLPALSDMSTLFSDNPDERDLEILGLISTFGAAYHRMLTLLLQMRGSEYTGRSVTTRLLRLRSFGYVQALTIQSAENSANQPTIFHLTQKACDLLRSHGMYAWAPRTDRPQLENTMLIRKRLIAAHCIINCMCSQAPVRSFRLGPVLSPFGADGAHVRPTASILGAEDELICVEAIIKFDGYKRVLLEKIMRYETVFSACKAPVLLFWVADEKISREIDALLRAIDCTLPVLYTSDSAAYYTFDEEGKRIAFTLASALGAA